jgi:hypothetical protein
MAKLAALFILVQVALIPALWIGQPQPSTIRSAQQLDEARAEVKGYLFYELFVDDFVRGAVSETRFAKSKSLPDAPAALTTEALATARGQIGLGAIRLTISIVLALVALLGLGTGRAPKNGSLALLIAVWCAAITSWLALLLLVPAVLAVAALVWHAMVDSNHRPLAPEANALSS